MVLYCIQDNLQKLCKIRLSLKLNIVSLKIKLLYQLSKSLYSKLLYVHLLLYIIHFGMKLTQMSCHI